MWVKFPPLSPNTMSLTLTESLETATWEARGNSELPERFDVQGDVRLMSDMTKRKLNDSSEASLK